MQSANWHGAPATRSIHGGEEADYRRGALQHQPRAINCRNWLLLNRPPFGPINNRSGGGVWIIKPLPSSLPFSTPPSCFYGQAGRYDREFSVGGCGGGIRAIITQRGYIVPTLHLRLCYPYSISHSAAWDTHLADKFPTFRYPHDEMSGRLLNIF